MTTCNYPKNDALQNDARRGFAPWRRAVLRAILALVALASCSLALANTCTSKASGNLNNAGTWNCVGGGTTPSSGGDIIILNTHTVTQNVNNKILGTVTVNAGGTFRLGNTNTTITSTSVAGTFYLSNGGANRNLVVTGAGVGTTSINVASGGVFSVWTAANNIDTVDIQSGDIVNAGSFDMSSTASRKAYVTFSSSSNQAISGAGGTYDFNRIIQNMGTSQTAVLEVAADATGFTINNAQAGYLDITNGTFKLSAPVSVIPFDGFGATNFNTNMSIPLTGAFYLNNASATVDVASTISVASPTWTVTGLLRIDAGTMNVTNAINGKMVLGNNAAAKIQLECSASPCALNVGGMFGSAAVTDSGILEVKGGTLTVATAGSPGATAFLLGSGTTLNLSGGTIVQRFDVTAGTGADLRSGTATVTGGTFQFADASTTGTSTFQISTANAAKLWDLDVNSTTSPSLTLSSNLTVLNTVTLNSGTTLIGSSQTLSVGGNFSNGGTFTSGTGGTCGTVSFIDNAVAPANASAILGASATSFCNLTVNNASGIDITTNPTITGALTFTAGRIRATSPKLVILDVAATVSGAGTGWVEGKVQKNYSTATACPTGTSLNATFPVGDASAYAGVVITGGTATGTGSLTVSTTTPDHPQVTTPITTTVIDKSKSLNRYWTIANATLTTSGCSNVAAQFTYPAGDNDGGATPANYIAQRYNQTVGAFFPTTLTAPTPTSTSLSTSQIQLDINVTNDIAIGEVLVGVVTQVGNFNAFDTGTTTGAITGLIQTKVSGTAFNLALVAVNAARTATTNFVGGSQYTVELYDATTAGSPNAQGCAVSSWVLIQSNTNLTPGAVARFNTSFTVANAYKKVRVRVFLQPSGATEGCSTDYFAIRPSSLSVAAYDSNYQAAATAGTARSLANAAATGGNVHSAATGGSPLPFTLRGTAKNSSNVIISTYQSQGGAPTLVAGTGACVDYGNGCTTGTLSIGAVVAATSNGSTLGEVEAPTNYDEAGAFTLQIEDMTFADADIPDGSTTGQRYVPAAAAVTIGRFVPAKFVVTTTNTPQLKVSCGVGSSAFTYIGQKFAYRSTFEPQARVTAQNSGGNITTNYRGSTSTTFHLTKAMLAQTYANLGSGSLDDSLAKLADGAMTLTVNSGAGASGFGTASLTISSNDRLLFTRNTAAPSNAFNAAIRLTVAAGDTSETGVTGNPTSIATTTSGVFDNGGTGIQFVDTANTLVTTTNNLGPFRYGRLRLSNAVGSEQLSLNVPIQSEYWASNGFIKNTDDTCTVLKTDKTSLSMGNYKGTGAGTALASGNMSVASNLTLTGANVNVTGYLKLSKPSPTATGSVDLTVNLDVASPGEDKTWLQGAWNGVTTYTANPTARASFGMYGAQPREYIYFRENF